jgi:hypothetical protein
MRLRARRDQRVRVRGADRHADAPAGSGDPDGAVVQVHARELQEARGGSGLRLESWHSDPTSSFALALLRRTA